MVAQSTIMVRADGSSIYHQMDYNELGERYEEVFGDIESKKPVKAIPVKKKQELQLATIIDKSIQREMFVRLQKNLILVKILADSTIKLGIGFAQKSGKDIHEPLLNPKTSAEFQQALEQVKSSQRRVSAIFSPLAFQLYPEQFETLAMYTADITVACAGNQDLPVGLLNEIELPRVQKEFSDAHEILSSNKTTIQNPAVRDLENRETNDRSAYLFSREYHLFLASIYLSEAVEQMEKVLGNEVEKLTKLIRPEVTTLENACSKIHKIFTRSLEKQGKWAWRLDFKTF
jgi:hypothetical protein